jgi:hypothetical protein
VTACTEAETEHAEQRRVIVDHQNPQHRSPPLPAQDRATR